MSTFTIVLIIIALVAVVWGFMQGIVRQIGSLVGIVTGIITARIFGPDLANWLIGQASGNSSALLTILAYVVIFLLAFALIRAVALLFRKLLHEAQLGVLDRIGGAIFKLIEWMFILSLVLNAWIAVAPSYAPQGKWAERIVLLAPSLLGAQSASELIEAIKI